MFNEINKKNSATEAVRPPISFITHELVMAQNLQEDVDNLRRIASLVEKNGGISTDLLEYINHDGSLSRLIPGIPRVSNYAGLESLQLSDAAMEGVFGAIREGTRNVFSYIKEHLVKYKRLYGGILLAPAVYQWLKGYAKLLRFQDGIPNFLVSIFFSLSAVSIMSLTDAPVAIEKILDIGLPGDSAEEYVSWKSRVDETASTFAGEEGTGKENRVTDEEVARTKERVSQAGGVKPAEFIAIVERYEKATSRIKQAEERIFSKLETLAKSPEAQTEYGAKALVYMTTVVTRISELIGRRIASVNQKIESAVEKAKEEEHTAS